MNIQIKTLTLVNFKGIKSLSIDFGHVTSIYGANAAGKSTIMDAWLWLLFGKDSHDRKDYEIKNTVDTSLNRADHVVAATLEVDGRTVTLKRVYREKWVTKKGSSVQEMSGHVTDLFYDDVPLSLGEYNAKIDNLLSESVFRLLTNPHYFPDLNWKDRRATLIAMAGEISRADVIDKAETKKNRAFLALLLEALNAGKAIDEYRAQIAEKKKKIKDELAVIPARIDELTRSKPEAEDWGKIEADIAAAQANMTALDEAMADKAKAYEIEYQKIREHQDKIHEAKDKRREVAHRIRTVHHEKINAEKLEVEKMISHVASLKRSVAEAANFAEERAVKIAGLNERLASLRKRWEEVNGEELDLSGHEFNCPTCRRELEPGDIEAKKEKLRANFQEEKNQRLEQINREGKLLKSQLEALESEVAPDVEKAKAEIEKLEADLASHRPEVNALTEDELIENDKEYIALTKEIKALEEATPEAPKVDTSDLQQKKGEISSEITQLNNRLSAREQIARIEKRIEELQHHERGLANSIAELEGIEFAILDYTKAEMDLVEKAVNDKFRYVRFKLFKTLINGGQEPTCEIMLDGVPWGTLNTAGKLKAGIDVINALSKHYNVSAPIVIDNRESVTEIPETDAQIINLVVSPADKVLRVEVEHELATI